MEQAKSARTLIVELCRSFYDQGWVSGTGGGISIREGDRVYMAPSGVQKERILERDLYVLDREGEIVERPADPQLKPSACLPLFFNAFRLRDAGAVIHSHAMPAFLATKTMSRVPRLVVGLSWKASTTVGFPSAAIWRLRMAPAGFFRPGWEGL